MVHLGRTHLGAPVLPYVNRSEHREVQGVSYDGAPPDAETRLSLTVVASVRVRS